MRGLKAQYKCWTCSNMFTARVADRNRGWARFCSKRCKQVCQEEGKKIWKILQGIKL